MSKPALTHQGSERRRRRILCVDDEPHVLSGLALNLGRRYEVDCARSGAEGLEILRRNHDTVVIVSDMRMPSMSGAEFLSASLKIAPDARRILLTGYADVSSAISAVNDGQICRFLTKPCAAAQLIEAIEFAIEDYDSELQDRSAIRRSGELVAARQDAATGLASREHLLEVLEQVMAERQLSQEPPGAVFMMEFRISPAAVEEVDLFAVDLLASALADRVREKLPQATCLGRWDAQRIVIYDSMCVHPGAPLQQGLRLVDIALRPLEIEGSEHAVDVSVGVVEIPPAFLESKVVLRHAELAAQEASEKGGNTACLFTTESGATYEYRRALVRGLRLAIAQEGLDLHYQPIIDLRTGGSVFALEALARWKDSSLGNVSPATFVPLAEASGLVVPFGEWTLRRACRDAREILDERCARISINVSISQLLDIGFLHAVHTALESARIDPASLMIEVTESVFAENIEKVCDILQTLRSMGMSIAIDDYGAGYSSLAYLSRLPVDALKIDGAFMKDFERQGSTIIASTLDLTRKLGIDAIVEGVENAEMLQQALSVGATLLQGFQFARPMPKSAVRPWISGALGANPLTAVSER